MRSHLPLFCRTTPLSYTPRLLESTSLYSVLYLSDSRCFASAVEKCPLKCWNSDYSNRVVPICHLGGRLCEEWHACVTIKFLPNAHLHGYRNRCPRLTGTEHPMDSKTGVWQKLVQIILWLCCTDCWCRYVHSCIIIRDRLQNGRAGFTRVCHPVQRAQRTSLAIYLRELCSILPPVT